MFTSADLIEFLRRRARRSLRPESAPGELPPGWRGWFAAMRERIGAITGASAEAMVAIMAGRPLRRPPRRSPQLNSAQAFTALWRQQWQPVGPEDRWQRIVAFALTVFMQLVFALFVLWLAYARYGGAPLVPPGEDVVQVEFIGEGTPEEQGGGEPVGPRPDAQAARSAAAAAAPSPAPAPAPAEPAPAPTPTPVQPQPPAPVAVTQPVPQRELPTPPEPLPQPEPEPVPPVVASQPLQATEVVEPDIDFVVPEVAPMQAVVVPRRQVEAPQLRSEIQALPSPAPALPSTVAREAVVRSAQVQVPGLERQVEALPAPARALPGVRARSLATGQAAISVPGLERSVEALPSRAAAEGNGEGEGAARVAGEATAAAGADAVAGGAGETPAAGAAVPGAGAGPESAARAGAWSTLTAGDDWGESDRNRDGGQRGATGLFDDEGRPRLPPGTGAPAGGGLPPGVVFEDIQDLDRAGTWLKRPPIDYTPTAFDRYWMPGGTLLEEWVRRGIREVQISIPGTSKKIHCVVSLLQLGGGCGINDPDMQDQEAEARPPPDVPWKPELQEK